jgi:hypothetical protein
LHHRETTAQEARDLFFLCLASLPGSRTERLSPWLTSFIRGETARAFGTRATLAVLPGGAHKTHVRAWRSRKKALPPPRVIFAIGRRENAGTITPASAGRGRPRRAPDPGAKEMPAEADGSTLAPAMAAPSAWSPLRHSLFRTLWIATVASHIGSYMTDVGQGWLMTTLAPSPLYVALMMTAESLPYFLLVCRPARSPTSSTAAACSSSRRRRWHELGRARHRQLMGSDTPCVDLLAFALVIGIRHGDQRSHGPGRR